MEIEFGLICLTEIEFSCSCSFHNLSIVKIQPQITLNIKNTFTYFAFISLLYIPKLFCPLHTVWATIAFENRIFFLFDWEQAARKQQTNKKKFHLTSQITCIRFVFVKDLHD